MKGIGVEEETVVCIELDGRARVFGNNAAHFLKQTNIEGIPEKITPNNPLTWYRNKQVNKIIM